MPELRTPKYLLGPELGIPSLSFRAWYEAQPALGGWDALVRIPRGMWMDYLEWYRTLLAIHVENEVEAIAVRGADHDNLVALETRDARGASATILARKVVFANGMEGAGGWQIPQELVADLPEDRYAHSADPIDFAALRDKRVGILGYGSSAADNAAAALQAGAACAELFCRRANVPKLEARAWIEHVGFLRHFFELSDAQRWRIMHRYWQSFVPAPPWSLALAASFPGFRVHMGASWTSTRIDGDQIAVHTNSGVFHYDFLIFATGFAVDLRRQREFAAIIEHAASWSDRYTPPPEETCAPLALCPYLGRGYELVEKHPGAAPFLRNIHLFNWGSTPSLGISASSITGMKFGVPRLAAALVRDLYFMVADQHADAFPRDAAERTE
jgi:cation diffusion facilitator CzcD-associated flavoprotein CzcO